MGLESIKQSIKGKLTQPQDEGRGKEKDAYKMQEEVVVLEETSPGTVVSTIKAADQMTGQTLNDVERLDDGGVVHLKRTDRRDSP